MLNSLSLSLRGTPWSLQHQEAKEFGYSGTLDDYVGLYNYVKHVRLSISKNTIVVSPTKTKEWPVRPFPSPIHDEITVLNTFKIKKAIQRDPEISNLISYRSVSTSLSSAKWLELIQIRIEREISRIPKKSFSELYRQRETAIDVELEERRKVSFALSANQAAFPIEVQSKIRTLLDYEDNYLIISKFGIDFHRRDLITLRSPNWLNDEVINFYMQMIMERSNERKELLPSIHVFSTFFFPKLRDRGYDSVRNATRRISPPVIARDIILFPIHLGMHWCMASIDFRKKTITYYDSLHGTNNACLSAVSTWLADEYKDKCRADFDFDGWSEICPKDIPAQQNSFDCGVFSLVYAEHISKDAPFTFSQNNMIYWRDRISYEIITGRLFY